MLQVITAFLTLRYHVPLDYVRTLSPAGSSSSAAALAPTARLAAPVTLRLPRDDYVGTRLIAGVPDVESVSAWDSVSTGARVLMCAHTLRTESRPYG